MINTPLKSSTLRIDSLKHLPNFQRNEKAKIFAIFYLAWKLAKAKRKQI